MTQKTRDLVLLIAILLSLGSLFVSLLDFRAQLVQPMSPSAPSSESVCDNSMDDDSDMDIDCADSDCTGLPVCLNSPLSPFEDCGNGVDDDSDMNIDCADSDCTGLPVCLTL